MPYFRSPFRDSLFHVRGFVTRRWICFAEFQSPAWKLSWHFVPYDADATARCITRCVPSRETSKFRIFHVLLHDQAPGFRPLPSIEWKASAVTHPATLSIFFSPSRTSVPFRFYPRDARQRSAPRYAPMSISNLLSFPFFVGRPVTIPGFTASAYGVIDQRFSLANDELYPRWKKRKKLKEKGEKSFNVSFNAVNKM